MVLSILKSLSLGIWLGAIIMLGIMAPTVFHLAPSRTVAGMLIGAVIERMNILEWICACVALASSAWMLIRGRTRLRIIEFAGLLIATGLLFYYSMIVNPHLNDLRTKIADFDHPNTSPEYIQQRAEFDTGHKLSSTLVQVNMLIILGCFVVGVVNARRKE